MQHFEIDWLGFSRWLPEWRRLSAATQRHLLTASMSAASKAAELGDDIPLLLELDFVTAASTNPRYLLHDRARPFIRALRAMFRHRILDQPNRETCIAYLQDNLTAAERNAMGARARYHMLNTYEAAVQVTSAEWVAGILDGTVSAHHMPHEDTAATVASITAHVLARGPVRIADLATLPIATDVVSRALCDALRCAAIFATIDRDGEPVLTVWPTAAARLMRPQQGPPTAVQPPATTFHFPILPEDAAALLVAAFAEPLRVRGHDFALFEKARARVAAALPPLPEDAGEFVLGWRDDLRINTALLFLQALELIDSAGQPGSKYRLEPTAKAREWLAKSAPERLCHFIDAFRAECSDDQRPAWSGYDDPDIAGRFRGLLGNLRQAMQPAASDFVDGGDLLAHAAGMKLPERLTRMLNQQYGRPTLEQRESLWVEILSTFMASVLIVLDGIEYGQQRDGRWAVRLTNAGRYLLGIDATFIMKDATPASSAVIVQPNFDVVFLSASPLAAASVGRFSERSQQGSVGTLFRITRASVQNANSAAIGADEILTTLRGVSAQPVPANVEREIRGWSGTTRRVTAGSAFLLHCPDEDTAAHVLAAAGKHGRRIGPTIVELTDPKQRNALGKKLRAKGIFVT